MGSCPFPQIFIHRATPNIGGVQDKGINRGPPTTKNCYIRYFLAPYHDKCLHNGNTEKYM